MIAVLQWLALGLCVVCAVWRLPAALRGRNVGLFWAFALIAIAVGLSLPIIYVPVDAVLGGRNFANLVLRFALYAIFFILAAKIAAAYRSARSRRLIRGPVGISVLILVSVGTVVLFLLSDLPVSSAGLTGYGDQLAVSAYVVAGRLYPAFAAACLILPTARAVRSGYRTGERVAAGIICSSFCMVVLLTVLQLAFFRVAAPGVSAVIGVLSYGSIVCLAVGFALLWISLASRRRRGAAVGVDR
ncbi:MAG TPA: hypothetical protein VIG41_07715 [Micrococcaceae bacterium]